MLNRTPREIVSELDKYIVGQSAAKRAVAIALRNRYRRRMLGPELRDEVVPKNILMIGPTGVGKTEIARRLARMTNSPFVKVEATKFTEVGYVGRDVDSMVRDLVDTAYQIVEAEKVAEVRPRAREAVEERLLDLLQPMPQRQGAQRALSLFGEPAEPTAEEEERHKKREEQTRRIRERLREQLVNGFLDERKVKVHVDDAPSQKSFQLFGPMGPEGAGMKFQDLLSGLMPDRKTERTMTVGEAREYLLEEEARKLVDEETLRKEAVDRAEQDGIIFIDEIDKIAQREGGAGPDVSRGGVQRDILPIIEGSTVQTKHGPVRTDYVLFIAAGAFHVSKPSDLIPELQGRLPIRVELDSLTEEDFRKILTEPKNSLVKQYTALLATEDVHLVFTEDGIRELARLAADVNRRTENIGARRLHTMMERTLEDVSFDAPELSGEILVDAALVMARLGEIARRDDVARYVL